MHDRIGNECHVAGALGGRQRAGIAAEVGAEGTAADAQVAILTGTALRAVRERRGQVGRSPDGERAAESVRQHAPQALLHAIELHRRQKLPVRKLRQILGLTADADEALDMIVPGREIVIADRPVDRDALARIGLEVHRAPAITLPAPHDGAPADVVAAYPVEALNLDVRIVQVVDEPVLGGLRDHVAARADGMAPEILLRGAAPVGQLPGILHGGRIVAMPDHAPAIEHQGLQALLGQLLGGPAAADARTDDDCIVGVVVHKRSQLP